MFENRRSPSFATSRARGSALPSVFSAVLLASALGSYMGCGAQPGGGDNGTTGSGGSSSGSGTGGASSTGSGGGAGSGAGGAKTTGAGGTAGSGGAGGAAGSAAGGAGGSAAGGAGGAAGRGGAGGSGGATGAGGMGGTAGSGGPGTGGIAGSGVPTMTTTFTCSPQTWDTVPIGWATQSGGTTGGSGTAMTVTSLSALNSAAGGTTARVIQLSGKVSGTVTIGSNKTILGMCGAEIDGHVQIGGSSNVIMRNIKVVGLNCTDNSDCQSGADAITVENKSTHIWFDHMDISNGSDGNLDITQQSDFVTVSWTKFSYSGQRAGGHQFSNLIGASDTDTSDTGHLRVTWHHDWWGDNVGERMPRGRFGQVHVFNSLYTATGDNAAIEVGVSVSFLIENNVFIGTSDPIDTLNYSNASSVAITRGNTFTSITGMFSGLGTGGFTPPYSYNLDGAPFVQAEIMSGVGVK